MVTTLQKDILKAAEISIGSAIVFVEAILALGILWYNLG
jgi:hypothetical protein